MNRRAIALILVLALMAVSAFSLYAASGTVWNFYIAQFPLIPAAIGIVFAAFAVFMVHAFSVRLARENSATLARRSRYAVMELRNNALIQAFPDPIFIVNRDGQYLDYLASSVQRSKVTKGVIIGKKLSEILDRDNAQRLQDAVCQVLDLGGMKELEIVIDDPDGMRCLELRVVALDSEQALYIARDVTERHRHEEALLELIREKESLLREVYHRVKNNLQVMSSLVSLQTDLFRDETDRLLMQETQHRIHTMAQLHDIVYRSGNFASVDLGRYLAEVVEDLKSSHSVHPDQIAIEVSVADIPVSLERALPIGLIVNELMSGSIKFSFSGARCGTITLQASLEGTSLVLEFRDTGSGFSRDRAPDDSVWLGWILIHSLVRQIGGALEFLPGDGTSVRILVPVDALS